MKRYEYKVYDRAGVFKQVITHLVTSQVRFSSQINGGQGQMTVDLDAPFSYSEILKSDIIKVWCFSDIFPTGRLLYTGFVSKLTRRYERSKTILSLNLLGISSLLSKMTLGTTYNTDPATIITDIINNYNTARTGIDITLGTIETVGSNMNIQFSGTNCFDALKQVSQKTGKWFYIGPDAVLHFLDDVDLIRAGIDGEIDSITTEDDLERVVNSVTLDWSAGTVTSSDSASITLYDTMKISISQKDLLSAPSAQNYADAYIAKYKDPKPKVTVSINDGFDAGIETIKPGMFLNILNSNLPYNNLQILKVEYTTYSVKLELSDYTSFSQEILG